MPRPLPIALALIALVIVGVALPAAPAAASDADFLAARAAFDRGDRARLEALAPKLSGHILETYVEFWRLKLRLETAGDDEVRAFLARWPGTPLAERLRADWLKSLGKRGLWNVFAIDWMPASGDDVELTCYGLQYRTQQDRQERDAALAAAKPLWFTGQATPDACEPLFATLLAKGDLGTDDRRARFRLATEAGNVRLAQSIAVDLPPDDRITAREFAHVDTDPGRALGKGDFRWKQQGGRELALYALERAARNDAAGVRDSWEKQRDRLPSADRLYGNARIAYHAARQLNPQANAWYREAAGAPLNEAQQQWRVRAALRAGAWPDVLAAVDAMPAATAVDPAWRYWRARALAVAGRADEADAAYKAFAAEFNFYALLAAEALGAGAEKMRDLTSAPLSPGPDALAAFGARPDVRRAVKLAELDLRPESQREWVAIVRGQPDGALLLAAEYARRQGLYDRAINTAERTRARHDFGLRYQVPYREHFAAAARDNDVDVTLLLGIARQESRFAPDIVSSAGAVGLMQLMPPTARWVAKQMNRADWRPAQIGDVATNTQFGAFYFKYWLDRLERMPALAAAAYNAGPNRAQAWRNGAPLEGAIWVETIPFNETRDYVKKVLANTMFYARELQQPYVALSVRLGTVPPRGAGAADPAVAATNGN
ncbi:MAG: transglycosylase SLT domain-containing protein [Betaproteobacteria bacterium]